jgi:predicted Zn finger-like uncharacterized protein
VIITCPSCDTKYRYDERRFDGASSKNVKCTSCGASFEALNPAFEPTKSSTGGRGRQDPSEPPTPVTTPPELEPSAALPPLPTSPRFSLAVIAGAQAGTVFQITKPRVYLGRGSAMDIQIRDSEVSRRHAVLEIRDPKVTLTDLGATNGTWVNANRVESTELHHQDEFTLGSTTLMLIVTPAHGAR